MTTDVVVPELGESVVEATIAAWIVKPGAVVKAGDVIVELETDKVSLEVEAPADGVLAEIRAAEGSDVNIGDVIARIDDSGAPAQPAAAPEPTTSPVEQAASHTPAVDKTAVDGQATPVARRMAQAEGVDLTAVPGTGSGGRVTKGDIAAHLEQGSQPQGVPSAPLTSPPVSPPLTTAAPRERIKLFEENRGEERIKMSRRRRTATRSRPTRS